MSYSFKIAYLDTDAICITKPDGGEFPKEEQYRLLEELNGLFPEHIKFSHDGFSPAMCVLKTKNRVYLTEEGKIKIKGSSLKSSKIEPALRDYQKKCIDALLGLSDATLIELYKNECKALVNLKSMVPWASRKALSEKTFASDRKNERSLREAVAGSGAVVGDRVNVYFTNEDKLKLIEHYDPEAPDHNFRRLLSKVFNSSKVFNTVDANAKEKVNYSLTTAARKFNDMARAKVLVEKVKKPSVKNSLQELVNMVTTNELRLVDQYAADRFLETLGVALELLQPREKVAKDPNAPKKTRKKKETPSDPSAESVDTLF